MFARAFANGSGGRVDFGTTLLPGPLAMFGSSERWPLLQEAISDGREWFYGDHAYFGRFEYYRVTRNNYQHDGTGKHKQDRFKMFGRPVQPWRKEGRDILICPNSQVYYGLFGMNVDVWLKDVTDTLKQHTDRPLVVRWKKDDIPITKALKDAWAVVAFTSASAIDGLLAGVPCFVTGEFAAPYRMGTPDLRRIESPVYPQDREQFMWNLAYQQWTLAEISNGVAWRALRAQREAHAV